jgi:prepilin-type N-terminal cleavage/methylation domain-containing protein
MLPTGHNRIRSNDARRPRGFTLIELILVMALLTIVIGLVAPKLSRFFRGRTQDSEAGRFLSLTHYGQSRAVSEGVPMTLWIDAKNRAYGLQQETGYTDGDRKAVDFTLDKALQIEVASGVKPAGPGRNLPAIRFMPDGTVGNTSVTGVSIREGDTQPIWIVQAANGLSYEIQDQARSK